MDNATTMKNKYMTWILATLRESAWAPLCVFGFYLIGLAIHLFDAFPPLDVPAHFMDGVARKLVAQCNQSC